MTKKVSVKETAQKMIAEDNKVRKQITDAASKSNETGTAGLSTVSTIDSFVNFAQKMGVGTDSPLSTASYGFNPITRNRVNLEWAHRGSWLAGVAVDVVADDMTRAGVTIVGELKPDQMKKIEEEAVRLEIWNGINDSIKWARLYGGCLAVMMIDGQDYEKPFRIETCGKGQFGGLMILDRWMVEPSLNDLVTEAGPQIGLPKFYRITAQAPAMPNIRIHYSRVIRLEGIRLPYWQRLQENLWGLSILERIYDRMLAFDSASTGAAQMVYKAFIRTYKVKGLREIVAMGGDALVGLVKYTDMMRRFQGNEGITLMDQEDDFEGTVNTSFSGLSEVMTRFAEQLSGALQIPLVRLFGQSPSGFNSGDSDVRAYYDSIKQQQERQLLIGLTTIYRCIAQSLGIKLPDGFGISFNPLWQLTQEQKAKVATDIVSAVAQAQEAGLISDKSAMQELKQSSHETGIFSNITDDSINEASEEIMVPLAEEAELESKETVAEIKANSSSKAKDELASISKLKLDDNLEIVIENPRNTMRYGIGWQCVLPEDYGYIRGFYGADADCIDCYLGRSKNLNEVWIVNQTDLDGNFDEHKIMIGFDNYDDARMTYIKGFSDGLGRLRIGSIYKVEMNKFKDWLKTSDLTKPYKD